MFYEDFNSKLMKQLFKKNSSSKFLMEIACGFQCEQNYGLLLLW